MYTPAMSSRANVPFIPNNSHLLQPPDRTSNTVGVTVVLPGEDEALRQESCGSSLLVAVRIRWWQCVFVSSSAYRMDSINDMNDGTKDKSHLNHNLH